MGFLAQIEAGGVSGSGSDRGLWTCLLIKLTVSMLRSFFRGNTR